MHINWSARIERLQVFLTKCNNRYEYNFYLLTIFETLNIMFQTIILFMYRERQFFEASSFPYTLQWIDVVHIMNRRFTHGMSYEQLKRKNVNSCVSQETEP